jgi:tungstate transport system substrate-binding protein
MPARPAILVRLAALSFLAVTSGCRSSEPRTSLTLATTTSTQDSGLLDVLVPMFRDQTGIQVKVVAVGSGQALELGRRGDADVLLTHSASAEERFIAEGWGSERRPVMHNDFVLVGPESDPAGVKGEQAIAGAFSRIGVAGGTFVSRGDESGTHLKEREIWTKSGKDPVGKWYVRVGSGMAQTIRIADEKQAYTLADRGTFLSLRKNSKLVILCQGDPLLVNRYSVILVSPAKHPQIKAESAKRFADFLSHPDTKKVIALFGIEKYGEPAFFPDE